MHWLLIFQRELRMAARRKSTYRHRWMVGGIVTAVAVAFSLFYPLSPSAAGRSLFDFLSWGGFVFCMFEGMRETSDCLAQERREGTLGLLFLTPLTGLDLVLGKLSAAVIKRFSTLLVMLPILALPIWMGGVTGGEFWRTTLAIMSGLFFALSAGMLASAMSVGSFAALGRTFLFLVAAMFLPMGIIVVWKAVMAWRGIPSSVGDPVWLTGPLGMFWEARELNFARGTGFYGLAGVYTVIASFLLLWLAGVVSIRSWRREENQQIETWWQRFLKPSIGHSDAWGGASAKNDPAVWLAERTLPGRKLLWCLIGVAAMAFFLLAWLGGEEGIVVLVFLQVGLGFFLKLWLAAISPQSLNAARRSGALELLLCTPVEPAKIVQGQLDALMGYFFPPAMVISIGLPIVGVIGAAMGHATDQASSALPILFMFSIFWLVLFLIDLFAVGYAGLWYGLTETQSQTAVAKTVFRVLIVPWLTAVIPCLGWMGLLAWPIFWSWWASNKLNKRFRDEVCKQFSGDASQVGERLFN